MNENREQITEVVYGAMCKVEGLDSFKCFSRNEKPHIWFCWYPKRNRGWWRVTRNYSIRWKHLTEEEKQNLHAAHEYVKILNQRYEDQLNAK